MTTKEERNKKIRKAINKWLKEDIDSIKAKEEPISKLIDKLIKEMDKGESKK